jgi:retinoid hydroxylase
MSTEMSVQLPPGSSGLPVLGDTLSIISDAVGYTRRQVRHYGPAFRMRFLGRDAVVLVGADAQRRVLGASSSDTQFSSYGGYSYLLPFIGGGSLLTLDGAEHAIQRKLVTPAFHSRHFGDYVERIERIVTAVSSTWEPGRSRVFYADAREMTFRMASSLVLGLEVGPRYHRLSHEWSLLFRGITDPLQKNLPFSPYGRAMAVKPAVDAFLEKLIVEHRQTPRADLLSLILEARHEDGSALSETELLDHARLLLFAAFDTTASTMTWTLLEVLRHPDVLARLEAELDEVIGTQAAPTPVELPRLGWLEATIKETLRLHPATPFLARGLTEPLDFGGYRIPAGWLVLVMHAFTQRMPEYFQAPEDFDPARFLPPREEDKRSPYAWVGFGAGAHTCLGMGIALMELKTTLAYLLRHYRIALVAGQDTRTVHLPINRPKSGVLITVQPR